MHRSVVSSKVGQLFTSVVDVNNVCLLFVTVKLLGAGCSLSLGKTKQSKIPWLEVNIAGFWVV